MPGRLPDPGPGAADRIRRLQTEPLPRSARSLADGGDTAAAHGDDVATGDRDAGATGDDTPSAPASTPDARSAPARRAGLDASSAFAPRSASSHDSDAGLGEQPG